MTWPHQLVRVMAGEQLYRADDDSRRTPLSSRLTYRKVRSYFRYMGDLAVSDEAARARTTRSPRYWLDLMILAGRCGDGEDG